MLHRLLAQNYDRGIEGEGRGEEVEAYFWHHILHGSFNILYNAQQAAQEYKAN